MNPTTSSFWSLQTNLKQFRKTLSIICHILATHSHFTCCVICCCEELHVAVVWWRLLNICWPNTHPNCHPSHEISVWKKYCILKWNICRNSEVHYSRSSDWLNEWLENLNTESDNVLCGSVESVCYCGFGVISSLCLLISLFELSSTHCPAPRVLASLAVFKKRIKKSEKESRLCNFYTWRFVHMYS